MAGRDVGVLAAQWADPTSPRSSRRSCPDDDLDCLASFGYTDEIMAVLVCPAVSDPVKAALVARLSGHRRRGLWSDLLRHQMPARVWVAISPALTPTMLWDALSALTHAATAGDRHDHWSVVAGITEPLRWRAELLRGLVGARAPQARALVAEAAPLWTGRRHSYATGRLSAPALATDTEVGVRVGLARNRDIRMLPDDPAGIAVREALLADQSPRVRIAARRNGVHVTETDVNALMAAYYQSSPELFGISTPAQTPAQTEPQREPPTGPSDAPREAPLPLTWSGLVAHDPLDDPDPRVRATAVRAGIFARDQARWRRVLADPSHVVRAAAATHGYATPPQVWKQLAADPDHRVRLAVARSRWVTPLLLRRLTGDADPEVRARAQSRVAPTSD